MLCWCCMRGGEIIYEPAGRISAFWGLKKKKCIVDKTYISPKYSAEVLREDVLCERHVCPSIRLPQPLLGDIGGTSPCHYRYKRQRENPHWTPKCGFLSRSLLEGLQHGSRLRNGLFEMMEETLHAWSLLILRLLPCSAVTSQLSQLCVSVEDGQLALGDTTSLSLFLMHLFYESKAACWVFTALLGTSSVRLVMQWDRHSAASLLEGVGKDSMHFFSIDLCPTLKIDDIPSDPLNHLKASSLFDQVCGEKLGGYPAPSYGMWCSVGTVPFTCAVRLY